MPQQDVEAKDLLQDLSAQIDSQTTGAQAKDIAADIGAAPQKREKRARGEGRGKAIAPKPGRGEQFRVLAELLFEAGAGMGGGFAQVAKAGKNCDAAKQDQQPETCLPAKYHTVSHSSYSLNIPATRSRTSSKTGLPDNSRSA